MSSDRLHNMKSVEMRTGLSSHLIRVWERRYRAVSPVRSDNLHRLYNDEDVERLELLAQLTNSGMSISRIAQLPLEELRNHKAQYPVRLPAFPAGVAVPKPNPAPAPAGIEESLTSALQAIRHYDIPGLENVLDHGMVAFGASGLLHKLLIPLLQLVGENWEKGDLTAAQEHGATAAIKDYLAKNFRSMHLAETAPRLLVATPAGQLHEMGASIAASLARKAGWHVTYLGPSLPAEEIASAALSHSFRAVVLSIIYPGDDPGLPYQLLRLRHLLPDGMPIIIGGRSAGSYAETIHKIGATLLQDMTDFPRILEEFRQLGAMQRFPRKVPSPLSGSGQIHSETSGSAAD